MVGVPDTGGVSAGGPGYEAGLVPVAVGGLCSRVGVAGGGGDSTLVSRGVTLIGIPVGSTVGGRDGSLR